MILVVLFNLLILFGMLWLILQGIKMLFAIVVEIFSEIFDLDIFRISYAIKNKLKRYARAFMKCIGIALLILAAIGILYAGWICNLKFTDYLKDNTIDSKYERIAQ